MIRTVYRTSGRQTPQLHTISCFKKFPTFLLQLQNFPAISKFSKFSSFLLSKSFVDGNRRFGFREGFSVFVSQKTNYTTTNIFWQDSPGRAETWGKKPVSTNDTSVFFWGKKDSIKIHPPRLGRTRRGLTD